MENEILRRRSFIFGGLAALVFLALGVYLVISSGYWSKLLLAAIAAVLGFTFVSCLVLDNNFVGNVVLGVFRFGFVKMPMLIFELNLNGIVWYFTVKLLFWILGIVLAIVFGLLAIALGAVLSIFVYPFALVDNIRGN